MIYLKDIGFNKDAIAETIVTTFDTNGQPNGAPMGIIAEENEQLRIRPFLSSLTYKNLQKAKCAVVNVTSNPELFYLTAIKEANPHGKLPGDMFERANTVDAPRLRGADAFIEVKVLEVGPFGADRADFLCSVKLIEASRVLPKTYYRAQYATIEAVIHATRIKPLLHGNKKEQEQASKLIMLVEACRDVTAHSAPNSRYSEIMEDITEMIGWWRKHK